MANWIFQLLGRVLASISEPLRETLVEFAKNFREEARKTENPWDDILADIICWLLAVP